MRLAILDFDGTLADSFPWFLDVLGETAARFGFRAPGPEEVAALRRAGSREILARLGVPLWKLPAIVAHLRAVKARDAARIPLFPGVPEMLRALQGAGVTLAMVSSDDEAGIRRALGAEAGLVAHWACGASLFGKARRMASVLRAARCPPARALAIGDEIRDAEAAREAGIPFAAVAWGYADPAALAAQRPVALLHAMEDIPGLFTAGR